MMSINIRPLVIRAKPFRLSALVVLLTLLCGVVLLHLMGVTPLARAQQCDIFGLISSDRTLGATAEGCTIYNATGSLVVNEGATLTIEPGTTMRFGADLALTVRGTLIARGTASNPVVFTAGTASNWGYIYFSPTSVPGSFDANGNYTNGSIIQYAIIEKAGSSDIRNNGAVRAENSVPYIDNITIRDNTARGLNIFDLDRDNYSYRIINNTITNNAGGVAVEGTGDNVQGLLSNNSIRDNTTSSEGGAGVYLDIRGVNSAVTLDSNTITGNITNSGSGGGAYIYPLSRAAFTITNNTISGNTGYYGGGIQLYTNNNNSIISGNTINGNTATYRAGGVYLSGGGHTVGNNIISNNTAREHGGGIYASNTNSTLTGNTINGNISQEGYGAAIAFDGRSDLEITFNTITSNSAESDPTGGIHIYRGSEPTINNNNIYNNTGIGGNYDIYNDNNNAAADIDASNNYWNTTSLSEIESRIFHGIDDASLGLVSYVPFSNSSVGTGPDPGPLPTPIPVPTAVPPPAATVLAIQSVSPAEGFRNQSTRITLQGSQFSTGPAPAVRLSGAAGSFDLGSVAVTNATLLAATVPGGIPSGTYDLILTNADGQTATLARAFTVLAREPQITQVLPSSGFNDKDSELLVTGVNFLAGAAVRLGATELATTRINGTSLLAIVPADFAPGSYDLTVANPDGQQAQRASAYTVLDDNSNDDLSGYSHELWLNPAVPQANQQAQLGLFVHRQGGNTTLENVTVRFVRDAVDGEVLGESVVPFLDAPDSSDSTTPIAVTFPDPGTYTVYASIDPDNRVPETLEDNNVVSRTVTIAPAAADRTVPLVQDITVDGDAATTTDADIDIGISATDPDPNASGVQAVHIIEYAYNESAEQWIPVGPSGWLPYDQTPDTYRWSLLPLPGMRYLQVRARDNADNVSIGNARYLVNYEPATNTVSRRQTRIYRYEVAAGQQLTVDLEVLSGDADLYVWSAREDQSARVSNLSGSENEQVVVPTGEIAPGIYQVEVYGFSDAEYRLTTSITAAAARVQAIAAGGRLTQTKELPSAPVVPVGSIPDERQGAVPDLGLASSRGIYLPLVMQ